MGVLFLAVLVLARTSSNTAWGAGMLLLSALTLALIFQSLYSIKDATTIYYVGFDVSLDIGAGFWISMAGAIILTAGAVYEQWGTRKK